MSEHHHPHDSHPEIVKRLKRAEGHLRGVIAMIEGGRSCLDIAQQLQAVEKAVASAKRTLIEDHLDHCLDSAAGRLSPDDRKTIDEFKAIARYL
ncbi:metal-sensing transcriptional repressor [Rhizobium sp. FKL33]|uniref:metal-sensing transcriptional repressor n=1 Tax=Rhizobium sp. FKL33 TaxID=2562307 RepID=UPI0010C116DB|nr:metal-sensing transcriptional repressor [Rhizobium sp. FKL33]